MEETEGYQGGGGQLTAIVLVNTLVSRVTPDTGYVTVTLSLTSLSV